MRSVLLDLTKRRSFVSWSAAFNRSGFSHFINSTAGRIFRLAAGTGFLVLGFLYRHYPLGVLSMAWSALPLSAGAFDVCFISAVLGGPLSGARIRSECTNEPGRNATAGGVRPVKGPSR
jgi:hypothetical protein